MVTLSVATFNVNCVCDEACRNSVASTIAGCGADVVCIQESNTKWESYLTGRSDLQQIYPDTQFHSSEWNRWAGFAVFSKYPIKSFEVIKETDRGWYPAGLVTLDIRNSEQETKSYALQLLVVHLRAPVRFKFPEKYWWGGHADWVGGYFSKEVKAKRLNEIKTFAKELRPGIPTIVLGDFNERRKTSECLKYLATRGLVNTPKSNDSCCGPENSWKFRVGGLTLLSFDYDHLVYSNDDLEAVGGFARVHGDGGSDHCLVSAEFRLKKQAEMLE